MRETEQTIDVIMTKEVIVLRPDDSLIEAAAVLRDNQFNGAPVVDGQNVLVGILTEYDLITKGSALHLPTLQRIFGKLPVVDTDHFQHDVQKISKLTVGDVMNAEPMVFRFDATLKDAVGLFAEHHRVNPVPVIDHFRRVVGIVSRSDILKLFGAVPQENDGGTKDIKSVLEVASSEVLAERAFNFLQSNFVLVNKLIENGHGWLQENQMLFRSLSAAASGSEDFSSALAVIVRKICEFSDWAVGESWIVDLKVKKLSLNYVWHKDAPALREFVQKSRTFSFGYGEGMPGRAWSLQKPLWDVAAEPQESFLRVESARNAGLHAAVAIPVVVGNDVAAILLFLMQEVRKEDETFIQYVLGTVEHLGTFLTEKFAEDIESILRQALEVANDAVLITTPEPAIIYVNPAWERLNGYKLEEVRGRNPSILQSLKTPKEAYGWMWETISAGKIFRTEEIINRRKDGTEYCEELTISPIFKNGNISFYMSITRDVTKRKETEKAREEVISLTAHQLRTPLTMIDWNVESLLKDKLGQEREDYLKDIFVATKTMNELVDMFLNAAKLEAGTFIVQSVLTDVAGEVKRIAGHFMVFAEKKRIKFEIQVEEGLPKIKIDPIVLGIALDNFLSNAVKYTPEEGRVMLEVRMDDGSLMIAVTDTGWGILPEEQPKIFTKLFRASNIKEIAPKGTGLGLYIVKKAMEQCGGKAGFVSEIGKGSTFWASFPVS